MIKPTANKCSKAGDLITTNDDIIEICLTDKGDTIPLKSDIIDFKYANSGAIRPNYNSNIIIMLDKNSVHTIDNGKSNNINYFLVNESSKEIYKNPGYSGVIYYCEGINCYRENNVGYFFNTPYKYVSTTAPYIECSESNNKIICSTISVTKTKCNGSENDAAAKGGELFKTIKEVNGVEINEFNICLDTTNGKGISVPIKDSYKFGNSQNYYTRSTVSVMVSTNTSNIFGNKSNKYVIAEINRNNVIRTTYYDLYKHTFENYMIIEGSMLHYSDTCNNNPNSIIEFEMVCKYDSEYNRDIMYFRKIEDNDQLSYNDNKNENNGQVSNNDSDGGKP